MTVSPLHLFGWAREAELQPKLEDLFGVPLQKSEERYTRHDWQTDDYLIELKARMSPTRPETYPDWLVPVCKFTCNTDKEIICFYYFEETKQLFYIIYDPDLFKSYKQFYNRNGQLTYKIPAADWTEV
jgi:uncharacterized protein YprB with RNaseH-like and TPR domain